MLNTVNFLAWSAEGKVILNSAKEVKSVLLTMLYQWFSGTRASGCLPANSISLFRVMISKQKHNISI